MTAEFGFSNHAYGWHTYRHTFGTILNANGENPKVIQELMRPANLKVTLDTYVQAVADDKREAQNKVVKMILPGIQRAAIWLLDFSGLAAKWQDLVSA